MYPCTCGRLGELEKAVERHACRLVFPQLTTFLILPNFHSCFNYWNVSCFSTNLLVVQNFILILFIDTLETHRNGHLFVATPHTLLRYSLSTTE